MKRENKQTNLKKSQILLPKLAARTLRTSRTSHLPPKLLTLLPPQSAPFLHRPTDPLAHFVKALLRVQGAECL
ncbi:hypothetical protein I7I50_07029 [Histoplasma capsulatum G186AR]|uniref:Uncharacterized protein n=1 Tax=Ajellomyces capsulatus TaxID=5037 RepID=A0A8H8D3C6_AJECA|nr:hypothetical protein I7I52_09897 [Histoplasma capsulatum]QSS67836.1 hypothetical protein I7I50_07029 [Histoplasma capsulatum G186AR]